MSAASDPSTVVPLRAALKREPGVAKRVNGSVAAVAPWAVAIVIGVIAQVYACLRRGSLWEDELIAITHANQPLPSFFIEVLRNDIHPPVYFLQLKAWMALGISSDAWALANSLFWTVVGMATMFAVARRLYGSRAAWIATALLSVLPSFVWSAGTLRMYAALPFCVLVVYDLQRRWFDTRQRRFLILGFLAGLITAYVHAIELFFVAFIIGGAFLEALVSGRLECRPRMPADPGTPSSRAMPFGRSLPSWVVAQVLLGLCLLPLAASGLMRGSDASAPSSMTAVLTVGGALIAGWKASASPWLLGAGTVVFMALTAAALCNEDTRWQTLFIPIAALVAAVLIALGIKPIFKQPVFAANLLPFIVIGAAAAAARSRAIALFLVGPCAVVLTVAAVPMVDRQAQAEGYAAAAHAVRDGALPGDLVVVPNVSVFWGVARYAIAPAWGSPLETMPPPNAEWSRLNQRIAGLLGPEAPRLLGLVPSRQTIVSGGVRYLIGEDAMAESANAPRVWVVTRERYGSSVQLDARLHPSASVEPKSFGDGELIVRRFDRLGSPGVAESVPLGPRVP